MKTKYAIGIDIGGTNTVIGLVDNKGNLLAERSLKTGDYETPEPFVKEICKLIPEMTSGKDFDGIGIGAPNGNFYNGTIEYAANLKWKGLVELRKLFSACFDCPIYVTNDANAAAIGEMVFGGARGMKHFSVITLGTGVGSGIVVDGKLLYGSDGFAGEFGHIIYEYDGRPCGCGRKGCLETYASAGGIRTTYLQIAKERGIVVDPDITSKYIHEKALAQDEVALETFDYTAKILGRKLADLVAIFSPEAIFLFGGPVKAGDLLLTPMKKYMEENMLQVFKGKVKLEVSSLMNKNAAILGAAALVFGER